MRKKDISYRSDIKRPLSVLVLALLLIGVWLGSRWLLRQESSDENFVITAFSVGKADALLLETGDTAILVDAGEEDDGEFLLKELEKRGIRRLDALLITHFDKDHVGGAAFLMQNLDVDTVFLPDYEGDRPEYVTFSDSIAEHPDVRLVKETESFNSGNLQWIIYPAENPEEIQNAEKEYDNDMSLVASVTYKEKRFLLTGDIGKTRIAQMLAEDTDWKHDWIKMPHHGRYQKELEKLLEAVQPSWAVICCSEKNPAEEKTLELLEERGIPVWDTAKRNVKTVCDGTNILVEWE